MEIKICTKCNLKLEANLHNFNAGKNGKYGLIARCKKCITEYRKEYMERPEAKEASRIRQQKWTSKNPEKSKKNKKKYREANLEKYRECCKKWSEANPERVKELNKKWRAGNLEKIRALDTLSVKELKDGYLKSLLRMQGFKNKNITNELIQLKKIIIKTQRLCKTSQI
jgi:restriction endonuclease Mrr